MNSAEGRRVRNESRAIQDAALERKNNSEEAAAIRLTVAGDARPGTISNYLEGSAEAATQAVAMFFYGNGLFPAICIPFSAAPSSSYL
eukprot:359760-Chlamydomonas_euryale.AAC.2